MYPFFGYLGVLNSMMLLLPWGSCEISNKTGAERTRHEISVPAMGVEFRVVYYAAPSANDEIDRAIKNRLSELENIFSDYKPTSELSKFCNASPQRNPQRVSRELWELSCLSQTLSVQTDGAFDVTVGNLSQVWRMARKRNRLPSKEKIGEATALTGYRDLEIHTGNRLRLLKANMKLDFGGIGKGYAADQLICLLRRHKIGSAMIDAGGDLSVSNPPPGKKHWLIQIEPQLGSAQDATPKMLKLSNAAVATSGDLHQSLTVDGKKYSHIIDPRTGEATTSRSQVTVIAPNATLADAYASAISVMGVSKGMAMLQLQNGCECLILAGSSSPDVRSETFFTRGWPQFIEDTLPNPSR
ncbi:MAG: FAD:protein FMN transferase [Mariniblastus sp.]|nr:FAD:protein FMN transferase [Mariniblastus sp.]